MKIFKMETPYAILYLLLTIVIPPLFIINLILLLVQFFINNKDNFSLYKNETDATVKSLISDTNKEIQKTSLFDNNLFVEDFALSNHLVVDKKIEFTIPSDFYILIENDIYTKFNKLKFSLYSKKNKDDLITIEKIINIKSFEDYITNSELLLRDVFYYKNLKMRKFYIEDNVIIEKYLKNSIYKITGLKQNEKIIEKFIKSIKSVKCIEMDNNHESKLYKFYKAMENYSEPKMRLAKSFFIASNNNTISKELLNILHKEIKNSILLKFHSKYIEYHYYEILDILEIYKHY